jgi:predicted transcriptional regulator
MSEDSMDAVFRALASPSRRRILDIVKNHPGANVNEVSAFFETSRIAVMKHLRILEEANLIHSEKRGRDRRLYFNAVPIQLIYDRWTTEYSALWASRMTRVKHRVESKGKKHGRN